MSESETILCPKCAAEIDLRASWCPMCRRPRSEIEVAEGIRKAEAPRRRTRSALWILLGLLAAVAAFHAGRKLLASMRAEPAAKAEPARTKKPGLAKKAQWTIEGRVYDLLDLSPVPGARLTFRDRISGREFSAATDAQGRYKLSLPPISEGGYQPSIAQKVYGDRFLEDISPSFSGQNPQARKDALPLLENGNILHVPILLSQGENSVQYDMVMSRARRSP